MRRIRRSPSERRLAGLIVTAIALAACGPGTPPAEEPPGGATGAESATPTDPAAQQTPVRTDQVRYQLTDAAAVEGSELVIHATYTNSAADTAYIPPCGTTVPRFVLEKREGDSWRRAWSQLCTMIGAPPLAVPPGALRTDTLRITGATSPDAAPRFEVEEIPGTYRLVYEIFAARDGDFGARDPLPTTARVSNDFEIVR